MNIVVITKGILKDSESHYIQKREFNHHLIHCFSQLTLDTLKKDLLSLINESYFRQEYTYKYDNNNYKLEQVRFWKLDSDITLAQAYEYVKQSCKKQNTYDYRIEMKGKFLDNSLDLTVENLNLSATEYLIAEVREDSKDWNFYQDEVQNLERCVYCNRYENLTIFCACKKASYCDEECKLKGKKFHLLKCDRTDGKEEEKELNITAESRFGLTGLSNVASDSMNSMLQCVSNTYCLTEYFLENRFIKEINKVNPLGSKGKLAEKYAILLKNMWLNKSSVYSSEGIKSAIVQINSIVNSFFFLLLFNLKEPKKKMIIFLSLNYNFSFLEINMMSKNFYSSFWIVCMKILTEFSKNRILKQSKVMDGLIPLLQMKAGKTI